MVPPHLSDTETRQFRVTMTFKTDHIDSIHAALDASGISWDWMNHERATAGAVFRRAGLPGYYTLRAPCMSCYCHIAQTADENTLRQCSILCH